MRNAACRLFVLISLISFLVACGACSRDHRGDDASRQGVYLFELGTGRLNRLTNDPGFTVAWTADGQSLWYSTNFLPGAKGAVRSIDIAGGHRRTVLDLERGGFASVAPDANRVAYVQRDGESFSVVVATGGHRETLGEGLGVTLSPDGAYAAFVSPPCAPSQSIEIADLDEGTPPREIAQRAFAPQWLPDGRISYRQQQDDPGLPSVGEAYTLGTAHPLPLGEIGAFDPGSAYFLSPDGNHALYSSFDNRVLLRDLRARTDRDLGETRASLVGWSPDSKLLAYATLDVLHVVSVVDGVERYTLDLRQLGDDASKPVELAWAPDGGSIAIGSASLPAAGVCDTAVPSPTP